MNTPNKDQKKLLKELDKFHRSDSKHIFTYSGPPGSGKTWVIGLFFEKNHIKSDEYITCAYSGKAANVLAMRGLPARTIHSLIYNVYLERKELSNGTFVYKPEFVLKEHLDKKYKYIVVDELSMVPDSIMEDVLSFGIKVIGMGDINQLPPVFGESSYMLRPDFCLTQIMRQAEGSPIIQLCQMVLHDQHISYGDYGDCRVMTRIPLDSKWVTDYDMILCNRNSTRDAINDFIRHDLYKISGNHPVIGDKIMCKQNNWDMCSYGTYLTNGTVGYVSDIFEETETSSKVHIDFTADFSNKCVFQDIPIDLKYLYGNYMERKEYGISSYTKFEYANAITVHSSQGSQYDRILYIDDGFSGSRDTLKKLKYTAISRAAKRIDIVNGYGLF